MVVVVSTPIANNRTGLPLSLASTEIHQVDIGRAAVSTISLAHEVSKVASCLYWEAVSAMVKQSYP